MVFNFFVNAWCSRRKPGLSLFMYTGSVSSVKHMFFLEVHEEESCEIYLSEVQYGSCSIYSVLLQEKT
jgi:hypothetical protein